MIWIEHDMQMVADLADRMHVLNYGRTLASGASELVLTARNVWRHTWNQQLRSQE